VREQSEMQVAITLYEVLYKKAFQGETFRGEMGFRMSVDLIGRECDKVVVELTCAGPQAGEGFSQHVSEAWDVELIACAGIMTEHVTD
jgi:hypothetical protein